MLAAESRRSSASCELGELSWPVRTEEDACQAPWGGPQGTLSPSAPLPHQCNQSLEGSLCPYKGGKRLVSEGAASEACSMEQGELRSRSAELETVPKGVQGIPPTLILLGILKPFLTHPSPGNRAVLVSPAALQVLIPPHAMWPCFRWSGSCVSICPYLPQLTSQRGHLCHSACLCPCTASPGLVWSDSSSPLFPMVLCAPTIASWVGGCACPHAALKHLSWAIKPG